MDFGPLVPASNSAIRELQPNQRLTWAGPPGRVFTPIRPLTSPPSVSRCEFYASASGSSSEAW